MERLDGIARSEEAERAGVAEIVGQSLQSILRRGWYWGSQAFHEKLVERGGGRISRERDRELRSRELFRRHGEKGAERILAEAEKHFGMTPGEMREPRRGDLRRIAMAWPLARRTAIPQSLIAEQLGLRSAANVSQRVRRFEAVKPTDLARGEELGEAF